MEALGAAPDSRAMTRAAARTVVVSCAAVALGTTEAAWTSFTGPATLNRAMVFVTTVDCGATRKYALIPNCVSQTDLHLAHQPWMRMSNRHEKVSS
jgi:hypothetical protein